MYRQCEEIEVFMYNNCSINHFVREFNTEWFSRSHGFPDHSIYEYTGGTFPKEKKFLKEHNRVA